MGRSSGRIVPAVTPGTGRLRVEQRRHLPPQRGGGEQHIPVGGERHAGPVLPQRARVLRAVGGGMEEGEGGIEEVAFARLHRREIGTGRIARFGFGSLVLRVKERL